MWVPRFRAVCQSGDFSGAWRSDFEDAQKDSLLHGELHADHELEIVSEEVEKTES